MFVPEKPSSKHTNAWHNLDCNNIESILETRPQGLSAEEASNRLLRYGKNSFTEARKENLIGRLLAQFKSPLTVVLLLAAALTFALEEYIDASVITIALLIAVVLGIVQEGRASRAFAKLSQSQVRTAMVVRGGKKHEISAEELVPGDLVILQSGMKVPADIRLLQVKKLSINEAALTGEWLAVTKQTESVPVGTPLAEITSMAYMGTFVSEGHGEGYVVETGDYTAVGKLANDLKDIVDEVTPLQREMAKVSKIMLFVVLALVTFIFLIGVIEGEGLQTMILTSIAIAVASIPEGLPAAVTIILAVGMESLLNRGGLVRNLLAAETLGSTTYVLTDKTGTLTKARMEVVDVAHMGCVSVPGRKACDWSEDENVRNMFDIALCASDAFLDEQNDEQDSYTVRGEPMERAILETAHEMGVALAGESARGRRVDYLSFSSENRFAAGVTKDDDGYTLCINGAPEYLLSYADRVSGPSGIRNISKESRAFFEKIIKKSTKEGKRLIAVSYKHIGNPAVPEEDEKVLRGTIFVGLIIFYDPVREGVNTAIKGVIDAGAEVRLITGDNPNTALTIAKEVGIAKEHDVALTGNDIAELDDASLMKMLETTKVFARVLPRQKMRLARVLQQNGEVVAMTGDGVNDAAALQKANIGIAIGSGTEVAKEASDLVLINDSFETIYAAIEEGRRIISNLRKIVGYLISTSLSEAILIAVALLSGGLIPILPAQILWANIIEEGLMSVVFAFEKGEKRAMKMRPQDIHEKGIISHEMLYFIAGVASVLSIFLLVLYTYLRMLDVPIDQLRSIMFLAISIDSLFIAYSFRSLTTPIWNIPFKDNMFFIVSLVLNIALLGIVISVPIFQLLLSYTPLPPHMMFLALLYGLCAMLAVEVGKWVVFERKNDA